MSEALFWEHLEGELNREGAALYAICVATKYGPVDRTAQEGYIAG